MRSAVTKWLLGAAMLCATALGASAQDDTVKIGAAVPITGPFANAGIQYYNSLRMAEEDINAAGGVGGKKFEIIFEDTQGTNPTAVNAFVKLTQQNDIPFAFLSSLSTQNLATEPSVTRAGIPVIYGGGSVAVQERGNPLMFRVRPSDAVYAKALAYGVKEIFKSSKPGIIHTQDDYGLGTANAVEKELAELGVTVVAKEAYSPRDNDFSAQLLSLKNSGADLIMCVTFNRDGALIVQQRLSLGIEVPFFCGSAMIAPATQDLLSAGEAKNLYSVGDTILGEAISPESAEFVKRYTEKFGFAPDPFGAAYYDSAWIVAKAIGEVGSDPEKIRDYLKNLKNYKGLARTYTTDEHNNMGADVVIVQFDDVGKFHAIGSYPPKQ